MINKTNPEIINLTFLFFKFWIIFLKIYLVFIYLLKVDFEVKYLKKTLYFNSFKAFLIAWLDMIFFILPNVLAPIN